MSHPFTKLFMQALRKSTEEDNLVLKKAEEILGRGYSKEEVVSVLIKLRIGLLDQKEEDIVADALDILIEDD